MKRLCVFITLICLFCVSCEMFTKPVFTTDRDLSSRVSGASTETIAATIETFASDPEQAAVLINELSARDKEEIDNLPLESKEDILSVAVSTVMPISAITEVLEDALGSDVEDDSDSEDVDADSLIDSVINAGTTVDTNVVEVILSDEEVLQNGDSYTLLMSSIALVSSAVKTETADGSESTQVLETVRDAVSKTTGVGGFDSEAFSEQLTEAGFDKDSVESLTVAVKVATVLNGTAGEGEINRKEDTEGLTLVGYDVSSLLNDLLGFNEEDTTNPEEVGA